MLLCVVSNCCLSPYLNIAGSRLRRGKMLVGSCKVVRFSVTERLGTLILTQTAFVVDTEDWCCMLRCARADMRTAFIAVFTTTGFCADFPFC